MINVLDRDIHRECILQGAFHHQASTAAVLLDAMTLINSGTSSGPIACLESTPASGDDVNRGTCAGGSRGPLLAGGDVQ